MKTLKFTEIDASTLSYIKALSPMHHQVSQPIEYSRSRRQAQLLSAGRGLHRGSRDLRRNPDQHPPPRQQPSDSPLPSPPGTPRPRDTWSPASLASVINGADPRTRIASNGPQRRIHAQKNVSEALASWISPRNELPHNSALNP